MRLVSRTVPARIEPPGLMVIPSLPDGVAAEDIVAGSLSYDPEDDWEVEAALNPAQ